MKFNEGTTHEASRLVKNDKDDLAAVELKSPANPVIEYSITEPKKCAITNLRGWGPTQFDEEPPLMHAIMPFIGYAGEQNDMGLGNGGGGFPAPGDSGAGVEVNGAIYGTLKNGNNEHTAAFAVPFAKIDNWIKTTTGVEPAKLNSRDLVARKDPQCGLICPGFKYVIWVLAIAVPEAYYFLQFWSRRFRH